MVFFKAIEIRSRSTSRSPSKSPPKNPAELDIRDGGAAASTKTTCSRESGRAKAKGKTGSKTGKRGKFGGKGRAGKAGKSDAAGGGSPSPKRTGKGKKKR